MNFQSSWAFVALAIGFCLLSDVPRVIGTDELTSIVERRSPIEEWTDKDSNKEELSSADLDKIATDLEELSQIRRMEDFAANQELIKRTRFSSWGGKRTPFSAWGGKRSVHPRWNFKRTPSYVSSAGKYEMPNYDDLVSDLVSQMETVERDQLNFGNEDGRRIRRGVAFSSWGGKRSSPEEVDDSSRTRSSRNPHMSGGDDNKGTAKVVRPARAAFSAWGGK